MGWILFLLAGTALLLRFGAKPLSRRLAQTFFVLIALTMVAYWSMDGITGEGIDESVLYHLASGIRGAGLAGYGWYAVKRIGVLCVLLAVCWWLAPRIPRRKGFSAAQGAMLTCLLLAFITTPFFTQLRANLPLIRVLFFESGAASPDSASLGPLSEFYRIPAAEQLKSLDKNIVLIYMEGLEKNFFNQDLFGDLVPNLRKLSGQAHRFTEMTEGYSTGWTMGGLVGSLCGVPLASFGDAMKNDFTGFNAYLPGATCLGELLTSAGYHTEFAGGASLEFGGKGDFLVTHGIAKAWGREELEAMFPESEPRNVWGFYDGSLLEFARRRFAELQSAEKPFFLSLLTLDTHPPEGYVSPECIRAGVLKEDDPLLDSVRCSDFLVAEFVRFLRDNDPQGNTLVVVMSDHYAHRSPLWDKLLSVPRELVFWVFEPGVGEGEENATLSTTFDVPATMLAYAGAQVDGLGFGRNLLDQPVMDAVQHQQLVDGLGHLAPFLWRPAALDTDLYINRENAIAKLGGQEFRLPVIIGFGDDFTVDSVKWPRNQYPLISHFNRQNSVMVANCAWAESQLQGQWCLYYRSLTNTLAYEEIQGPLITAEHIKAVLQDQVAVNPWDKDDAVYIVSSGGHGRFSGVISAGQTINFTRGVNFVQVKQGAISTLARYDTCGDAGLNEGVAEEVEQMLASTSDPVIVAVSDSAVCGDHDHSQIAQVINSGLFQSLGFREPYVAELNGTTAPVGEFASGREGRAFYRLVPAAGERGH